MTGDGTTTATTDEPVLPGLFTAADRQAMQTQALHLRHFRAKLALMIVAATGGAVGAFVEAVAWVSVVAFILIALVQVRDRASRVEQGWYDARAVAESIKTLSWLFAVRAGPFDGDVAAVEAEGRLRDKIRDILDEMGPIAFGGVGTGPVITDWMRSLRESPFELRRDVYERERIAEQVRWYGAKAAENERAASRWDLVFYGLTAVSIALATALAAGAFEADLTGLFSTSAVAVLSWTTVRDHATLARAYAVAFGELCLIRDEAPTVSEEAWSEFAKGAEEAISREHTLWLARRS